MIFGVASLMGSSVVVVLVRPGAGSWPRLPTAPEGDATAARSGVAVSSPVARDDDQQNPGIRLDDGTWVDVGPDGRWRPSPAERIRAAVVLTVLFGVLLVLALLLSGDDGDGERELAVDRETTTTEAETTTTTSTTAPPDPSSIGGEPASERCAGDDRSALPLRERNEVVVLVLNGTSRSGHAGAVTGELTALGYSAVEPGNAGRLDVTSVGFVPGWCAEGERVAQDLELPGAIVEPAPEDLPVPIGRANTVVTLGADSL